MTREDVRARFARNAANYVTSGFHADQALLDEVVALALPQPTDVALDVATGTGNTAFALAPHVARVVGLDLTPEMLDQARRLAAERGVANVEWVVGDAQQLPFPDASFDLYTVRAAPHHFPDLDVALREAFRVLKPQGRAVFVDCSPPPAAREVLHQVEMLRDPSHVRSYTLQEWKRRLKAAGFRLDLVRRRELDWDFEAWNLRIGVPVKRLPELAVPIEKAGGKARNALRPERRAGKLWHAYWHAEIRAVRP